MGGSNHRDLHGGIFCQVQRNTNRPEHNRLQHKLKVSIPPTVHLNLLHRRLKFDNVAGLLIGRDKVNGSMPNETVTASSEFDQFHAKHKVYIYSTDPPAAWCPSKWPCVREFNHVQQTDKHNPLSGVGRVPHLCQKSVIGNVLPDRIRHRVARFGAVLVEQCLHVRNMCDVFVRQQSSSSSS